MVAISRRNAVAGLLAAPAVAVSKSRTKQKPSAQLARDVGELLMLGFRGHTVQSQSVQILAGHLAAGRVSGVCFVLGNVGSREEVLELTRLFALNARTPPLIAIDHEGGSVQRLTTRQGFTVLPSAEAVVRGLPMDRARALYAQAGAQLAAAGFTVNLAPVVDLNDPDNPEIGGRGRAFSADPAIVASYAEAFIDGFTSAGIRCVLKHFPGAGSARKDSHAGAASISAGWTPTDLLPFRRIIASGRARAIMNGHFLLRQIESAPIPTSLSPAVVTGLLRDKLGYTGVAMTDDLDMKAVTDLMPRHEAVVRALAAGNDLLTIFNQDNFDPELPQNVVAWVADAIAAGVLSEKAIALSAARVRQWRRAHPAAQGGTTTRE